MDMQAGHVSGLDSVDYWAYVSGLRRVNPGLKMATALFALLSCVWSGSAAVGLFTALACAAATVLAGRVPLGVYLRRLRLPLAFVLMSTLALAVDFATEPVGDYHWRIGPLCLCVFTASVQRAAALAAVALGALSAMCLLAFSTTVNEMTAVLERVHVPRLLIELMSMVYRFVFIMAGTWEQLQTAARSRLGYSGYGQALRTFGGLAGNLFIVSLLNANGYYDALQSRCYQGRLAFLEEEKPLRAAHVGAAAAFCAAIALVGVSLA